MFFPQPSKIPRQVLQEHGIAGSGAVVFVAVAAAAGKLPHESDAGSGGGVFSPAGRSRAAAAAAAALFLVRRLLARGGCASAAAAAAAGGGAARWFRPAGAASFVLAPRGDEATGELDLQRRARC
jgi:hypothetical protein